MVWQVRQDAASIPLWGVWQDSHCEFKNPCAADSGPGLAAVAHRGNAIEPDR